MARYQFGGNEVTVGDLPSFIVYIFGGICKGVKLIEDISNSLTSDGYSPL